ncbi:MAG: flagellar basal body L-ring protein FlgH [Nitrospirae bacterium]|nr:flagellar basal body L-ring protein FlgH [Nitrospirota bacterium]
MKYLIVIGVLIISLLPGWCDADDKRQIAAVSSGRASSEDSDGSLWSEERQNGFLFGDLKAHNVGDVVTVRIVESSSGKKNASTKTAKDSNLSTSISAFFGMSSDKLSQAGVGAETSESHDGSGSTSRSSDLTAVLTAKVIDRLPNGNLVIDGRREVIVNNETQLISLSGTVRPEDIGPGNMVLSTYISDARITYTGDGVIGDKQKVGWFVRIIDKVWPF